MAKVVFGVLIGAAGLWKLMGTFSGGSSSKIMIEKNKTNGIGKGWIILICFVLVGLLFLNKNAEQIRHNAEEQAPVFVVATTILFVIFILYLKGVF